jgi:hypothetical protein
MRALLTAGTVYVHTSFSPSAVIDAIERDRIEPEGAGRPAPRRLRPGGVEVALHVAMYLQVKDGHITRIEEYLDSAQRASIRRAREALSG